MKNVRRFSYLAFGVACAHLLFGAIVRISGSGMGCGDHWPKCYGSFFPPLDRPDLIIEVSHRYLASILLLALITLAAVAWRHRSAPGVGGRGGVLRSSLLAVGLGVTAALLGAVTVKLGNAPFATLAHWTVAMSLVATVVASVIRAGGLGGRAAREGGASAKTKRASAIGAAMALLTVVMGGLTAKYPGAAVACRSFPLCGANPDVVPGAVHIQLTHRVLALLLVLHLFGLVMALRKRREAPVVRRAALVALSLGVLQLLVAGAMIGMHLPPVLRSLHEGVGVSVWISAFVFAYLARIASGGSALGVTAKRSPAPDDTLRSGSIRVADAKPAYASAVAERGAIEAPEPWRGATDAYLGAFAAVSHSRRPDFVILSESRLPSRSASDEAKDLFVAEVEATEAGPSVAALAQDDIVVEVAELVVLSEGKDLFVAEVEATEAVPSVAALAQDDIVVEVAELVVLSEAKDLFVAEVEATEVAPSVAALAQDDIVTDAFVNEIIASASAVLANAVLAQDTAPVSALAKPARSKSTMHHSVAVIIARGADL